MRCSRAIWSSPAASWRRGCARASARRDREFLTEMAACCPSPAAWIRAPCCTGRTSSCPGCGSRHGHYIVLRLREGLTREQGQRAEEIAREMIAENRAWCERANRRRCASSRVCRCRGVARTGSSAACASGYDWLGLFMGRLAPPPLDLHRRLPRALSTPGGQGRATGTGLARSRHHRLLQPIMPVSRASSRSRLSIACPPVARPEAGPVNGSPRSVYSRRGSRGGRSWRCSPGRGITWPIVSRSSRGRSRASAGRGPRSSASRWWRSSRFCSPTRSSPLRRARRWARRRTAYCFAAVYVMCLVVQWLGRHWLKARVLRLLEARPRLQAMLQGAPTEHPIHVPGPPGAGQPATLSYALGAAGVPLRTAFAGDLGMSTHMLPDGTSALRPFTYTVSQKGPQGMEADSRRPLMLGLSSVIAVAVQITRLASAAIGAAVQASRSARLRKA